MKRSQLLMLVSCLALVPSTTVMAADVQTVEVADWSGAYVGVHGGYSWGSAEATYDDAFLSDLAGPIDMEPEGFYGGLQVGYNHQSASNWVFGVEADIAFASISDEVADKLGNMFDGSTADTIEAQTDWAGTLRGRLGYAMDNLMVYATGGLAFANSEVTSVDCESPANINCNNSSDEQMLTGYAVGAGAEVLLSDSVSAKLEYLYTDYGPTEYFSDEIWTSESESSSQNIRVGLNYHF